MSVPDRCTPIEEGSEAATAELFDGFWDKDDPGTWIEVVLPPEWLSDNAPYDTLLSFDLVALIEDRLAHEIDEDKVPTIEAARRTITALRAYADVLEREFVHGAHRWSDEAWV